MAVELTVVQLSPDGHELASLAQQLLAGRRRVVLGLAGAPGTGKSTLAAALAATVPVEVAVVPLDGFHLADVELVRQGLAARKGAAETFDAWGYAALLQRIRRQPDHVVYAPSFERGLEQPVAGAIPVPPSARLVVTEGNYLLLEEPPWRAARATMDAVWFLRIGPGLRRRRLHARHVAFGKGSEAAHRWIDAVDEPNADQVAASMDRADLVLDLDDWQAVG